MTNELHTDETTIFSPKWDANGLMPCVTIDDATGAVLMVAYMNEEALHLTIKTRKVHYWSRSRGALWLKGETSGHIQTLRSLAIDCDQDTLLARVNQSGAACHTGRQTCFYRTIALPDSQTLTSSIELTFTTGGLG